MGSLLLELFNMFDLRAIGSFDVVDISDLSRSAELQMVYHIVP
jgi:hypothetical protein